MNLFENVFNFSFVIIINEVRVLMYFQNFLFEHIFVVFHKESQLQKNIDMYDMFYFLQ